MSDISSVSSSSILDQYSISNITDEETEESASGELGKTEFLELMIAQLNNQNPLDPQENADFVAELAQFSMVEGIDNMSSGFDELATAYNSSQALQASSLVGSSVTISGEDESQLVHGEIIYGITDIPENASNVVLTIKDEDRQTVEEISLSNDEGELTFKWDGAYLEVNGEIMDLEDMNLTVDEDGTYSAHEEGTYTFSVSASVDGTQTVLDSSVSTRVESVSIDSEGTVTLNLLGGDSVAVSDVLQINDIDG